jgi:hypothetical protein
MISQKSALCMFMIPYGLETIAPRLITLKGETETFNETRLLLQFLEGSHDSDHDHSINHYSAGSGLHLLAFTFVIA